MKVREEDGAQVWTHGAARLEMRWWHDPLVALLRFRGRLTEPFVPPVLALMDAIVAQPDWPQTFVDIGGARGYARRAREPLYRWVRQHRRELGPIHVHVQSPLLRAAVATANLALGGLLTTHGRRGSFERALFDAVYPPADTRVGAPQASRP